jgi:hypothetical protein
MDSHDFSELQAKRIGYYFLGYPKQVEEFALIGYDFIIKDK